ncbi:hypothetical protein MK280_03090, partial [Myxococcota bacterium]|nr:hypothetical protein [Myxococcota bacterium]
MKYTPPSGFNENIIYRSKIASNMQSTMEIESSEVNLVISQDHGWWQDRLAERFFPQSRAGQRVRLNIDEDDFPIDGGELQSLIDAMHVEVAAEGCDTVLELLAKQAERYQRKITEARTTDDVRCENPPPVLPGLSVLVLAVHHGGSRFEPNEYYDRLRDLMGYEESVDINSGPMAKASQAWAALEKWSCRLQMGRRGLFEVRVLGGMRFIGVPMRQALLSPKDEDALEEIFAVSGLEPNRELGNGAALRMAKSASLRARARKVLAEYPSTRASQELVDDVIDVYESWDGEGLVVADTSIVRRPIRLRFQNRFPVFDNLAATCVFGSYGRPERTSESPGIRMESTELRDGGAELMRDDGASLAEDLDWFSTVKVDFALDSGRRLECFRKNHKCRWFAKQGENTWVEQFEDELEVDRTYVELRRADDLTDTPGAGSGGFHGSEWQALEHPTGMHVRTFRFEPSTNVSRGRRISGRFRGGIRT